MLGHIIFQRLKAHCEELLFAKERKGAIDSDLGALHAMHNSHACHAFYMPQSACHADPWQLPDMPCQHANFWCSLLHAMGCVPCHMPIPGAGLLHDMGCMPCHMPLSGAVCCMTCHMPDFWCSLLHVMVACHATCQLLVQSVVCHGCIPMPTAGAVCLVTHGFLNMMSARWMARFMLLSGTYQLVASVVVIALIPSIAPTHQSADFVFRTFNTSSSTNGAPSSA